MSDIQEEQKRLYKRAEENDRTDTISIQDLFDERIEQNKRIEELVNINEKLSLALESAEQRIDKAIEYINNNSLYEEEYDYDYEENIHLSGIDDTQVRNDLLNILKGKE